MKLRRLLLSLGLTGMVSGTAACSNGPPEPASQGPLPTPATEPDALTADFAGYRHTIAQSRFPPSNTQAMTTLREGGFDKIIGDQGVFATDVWNGWVLALPNAGATITQRPPFPGNADDHNAHTLEYFRAAGIPQDQVHGAHVTTLMKGGVDPTGARIPDQFLGYYSVLERSITGASVVESQAWARFNVDGDVVEESVYWPSLPASLGHDVAAFNAVARDPQFLAKLTAEVALDPSSAKVAIHHSSSTDHRPLASLATLDMLPLIHRKPKTYHFDLAGQPVKIPSETESTAIPSRGPRASFGTTAPTSPNPLGP